MVYYLKFYILILKNFHVETDCGNGLNILLRIVLQSICTFNIIVTIQTVSCFMIKINRVSFNDNQLRKVVENSHKMVVFPALSRPKISILTSLEPNMLWNIREKKMPIAAWNWRVTDWKLKCSILRLSWLYFPV